MARIQRWQAKRAARAELALESEDVMRNRRALAAVVAVGVLRSGWEVDEQSGVPEPGIQEPDSGGTDTEETTA